MSMIPVVVSGLGKGGGGSGGVIGSIFLSHHIPNVTLGQHLITVSPTNNEFAIASVNRVASGLEDLYLRRPNNDWNIYAVKDCTVSIYNYTTGEWEDVSVNAGDLIMSTSSSFTKIVAWTD